MTDSSAIIEARGLDYSYPGAGPAIRGVSLAIHAGERLALLGPNGAGKTTLLLHLNGILKPAAGEIFLEGRPADYSRRGLLGWRQKVGLIFQNPDDQLFSATVYQDVSFGPLNLGLPETEVRKRVDEALSSLEIGDLRNRPTHMLSFGQKKRVAIAGVLAMRPRMLILDEPTAGLDSSGTEHLLEACERLHQAGTTLILATNDIDLAYGWADELAVLHQGAIVGRGNPESVLQDPAVLGRTRLRMPRILELSKRLQELGCLSAGEGLPRTQAEMLRRMTND
jgi:cobalt/nickel transport system ATP-binding protein